MMACADPQMIQESTTFKVMTGTVNFEVNGKALTITAADNSVMNLTSK
jgi:heat shock protein HslJ